MRLPVRLLKGLSSRRRQRGQALVLGALSFLVLALMVTLSFNLSQALREKIRLQQHSDSMAYSMAVLEARALNYYAVTNRSIAASYVAMNSLHAYMAAASVTGEMMRAASTNFNIIAAQEFAQCGCKGCQQHCVHGAQALRIANKYDRTGSQYDRKVRGLEGDFRKAITALDGMVDTLHDSQRRVHERTREALKDGRSHGLAELARYNAPEASDLPEAVGNLNANEFDCAVDGMPCSGGHASSSKEARARVMTEISNATRAAWPAHRAGLIKGGVPEYLHPSFLEELKSIPDEGTHFVYGHQGTAKTVRQEGDIHQGQTEDNTGLCVSADEQGGIFNQWKHGLSSWSYKERVWSDKDGGGHDSGGAHSGSHRFEGVNARALTACSGRGNCFMKFRATPDAQRDWGQPRVYAYLTDNLRVGGNGQGHAPWELNASGSLSFDHGQAGKAKVTLAPGVGAGLSKALVYYHRFDPGDLEPGGASSETNGWREGPNLFGPYWRGKLHPFTPSQAEQVLRAAGNPQAAQLVRDSPGLSL